MKKIGSLLLISIIVTSVLFGCTKTDNPSINKIDSNINEKDTIIVYTSFYPMYDFASKIGGNRIQVTNMVPAGGEPHDWEPTATNIVNLEDADMFIYNGAGMEHWVEDILESLENKDLVAVEASQGIDLMNGEHHHGEDEDHDEDEDMVYDPHVWLSPMNAKIEMENIKSALVEIDPENKEYYENNYSTFVNELDILDKEFRDTLSKLPNKDIIVSHEAFGYLCQAYGLNQIGIQGLSADAEPSSAKMGEIIDFVKENNIKVIFFEELGSQKISQTIADETNAEVDVLNPIGGLTEEQIEAGDDYFSIMRKNLEALKSALE